MALLYWMKLWYEILDDPKIGMLSDHLKWTTIQMFLCAGENGKDGLLPSVEFMAWRLRVDAAQLEKDLIELSKPGLVKQTPEGWFVTNFKARQEKPPKSEYMRRRRERDREGQYNGWGGWQQSVTNGNDNDDNSVTSSNTDTDTDTDTDIDIEQILGKKTMHERTLLNIIHKAQELKDQELFTRLKNCKSGDHENTFIIYSPDEETKNFLLNGSNHFLYNEARCFSGYRELEIR